MIELAIVPLAMVALVVAGVMFVVGVGAILYAVYKHTGR